MPEERQLRYHYSYDILQEIEGKTIPEVIAVFQRMQEELKDHPDAKLFFEHEFENLSGVTFEYQLPETDEEMKERIAFEEKRAAWIAKGGSPSGGFNLY